jgi:hypothetical protein
MGRSTSHTHFTIETISKGIYPSGQAIPPLRKFLCGHESKYTWVYSTEEPERVSCLDCARALAAKAMAARPAGAPVLRLGKVGYDQRAYRYAYEAFVGEDHVGYVVFEGAYGSARWMVCSIGRGREDSNLDQPIIGYSLTGGRRDDPLAWPTKEQALVAVEGFAAEGRLKTVEAIRKEAAERLKRQKAYAAQLQADEAFERQRLDGAKEGLEQIITQAEAGELTLTNFQREALSTALEVVLQKRTKE